MTSKLTSELNDAFAHVTLRQEAAKTFNAKEWKEYQKITQRHGDIRRYEERLYKSEYATRVEVARRRLMHKAAAKQKVLKPRWFGRDQFDSQALTRQAHRDVRAQHKRLMDHLERQELKDVKALVQRSQYRNQLREKPKRDFNRAVDRRSGVERRRGPKRSRS
jgi:hypothetical protein